MAETPLTVNTMKQNLNTMKQYLPGAVHLWLTFAFAILIATPQTAAQFLIHTHEGQTLTYWIPDENEDVCLVSNNQEISGNLVIPDHVGSYIVAGFVPGAFRGSGLTSVTLPNSITSIRARTFYGCTGLTDFTIPNSAVSIGEEAFFGCTGLKRVSLGNSVTTIGNEAFAGCTGLTNITIPNSVTSVGSSFKDCTGLRSITLGNSVATIGNEAFAGCTGLTNVKVPNSVTSIGSSFKDCTGLRSITLGNSVMTIGNEAFAGCGLLSTLNLPNSVISVGENAFRDCSGLRNLTIGSSVSTIDIEAFRGCSGITSLSIPGSVTHIGRNAFHGCSSIKDLVFEDNDATLSLSYNEDILFSDSPVESLYLGRNLSYPGHTPSAGFTDSSPFRNSTSLKTVVIGNSVTTIGRQAFYGCSELTTITIPGSVTSIGSRAFDGCGKLNRVNIMDLGKWCQIEFGDIIANPLYYAHRLYSNEKEVKHLVIPPTVSAIGRYSFVMCWELESVTVPGSVTAIGSNAFYGCTTSTHQNFKAVNITDLEKWCGIEFEDEESNPLVNGHYLYLNGKLIEDLVIPESIETINDYCFDRCWGFTGLTLPNSIKTIGKCAFENCFWNNETGFRIKIPDSVFSIGDFAFSFCGGITDLAIGNSVTSIGDFAFQGDEGFSEITIPESTTSIGTGAFDQCYGLTTLTIGKSVATIGYRAFTKCNLENVYSLNPTPPVVQESEAFDSSDMATAPLHVPKGTETDYRNAAVWQEFANIIGDADDNSSIRNTVWADDNNAKVTIYNLSGVKVYEGTAGDVSLPQGIYIVRQGSTARRIYLH